MKSRNWLGRLFVKPSEGRNSHSSTGDAAKASNPIVHSIARGAQHDATEYNWASFFCPYCDASSFVHCSGGHLVCDGTATLRNGRRFHQCYCGTAGFIEGTIKTIEADRHTFTEDPNKSKISVESCEGTAKKLARANIEGSTRAGAGEAPDTAKLPSNSPPRRTQR